jgi:glutamyl-tRNA synthetase
VQKFLSDASVRQTLRELGDRYATVAANDGFTEQSAEETLRALATEKNLKAGALINGARVALTGQAVAPSLFAVMMALGRERTVARLLVATKL